MQEKFEDISPDESESEFIKAWDRQAQEGRKTGMSCHCPLLPWVKVLSGPLDLRLEEAQSTPGERGVQACSEKSTCWCPLS